MKSVLIVGSIVIVAFIIGYISSIFLGKDNPVEEECEKVIKDETGLDVDLTPVQSPDQKQDQ